MTVPAYFEVRSIAIFLLLRYRAERSIEHVSEAQAALPSATTRQLRRSDALTACADSRTAGMDVGRISHPL